MTIDTSTKTRCGAQRNNQPKGVTCTQRAGWGTDHPGYGRCKRHGGNTPSGRAAGKLEMERAEAEKQRQMALETTRRLGIMVETSPAEALMGELWETCGNVEFYRLLIQQLPTHPDPDTYFPASDENEHGFWERGQSGLYGRIYAVSGVPTGEAKPHVLVQLYMEERKRKAEIAAAALRVGIDERRLQIAEADAAKILHAQVQTLLELGMGDMLEQFREVFTQKLRDAIEQPASLGTSIAV